MAKTASSIFDRFSEHEIGRELGQSSEIADVISCAARASI